MWKNKIIQLTLPPKPIPPPPSGIVINYKLAYKLSQLLILPNFLQNYKSKSSRIPLSSASLTKWHMTFYFLNLNSRQNQKLRQFISHLISYEIPDEISQYI
jgi:hypothetical protein